MPVPVVRVSLMLIPLAPVLPMLIPIALIPLALIPLVAVALTLIRLRLVAVALLTVGAWHGYRADPRITVAVLPPTRLWATTRLRATT
jgi:hypothetical protein